MRLLLFDALTLRSAYRSWFSNPLTGMVESGEAVNRELVVRALLLLRARLLRTLRMLRACARCALARFLRASATRLL